MDDRTLGDVRRAHLVVIHDASEDALLRSQQVQ
jgi:hypothetical protein